MTDPKVALCASIEGFKYRLVIVNEEPWIEVEGCDKMGHSTWGEVELSAPYLLKILGIAGAIILAQRRRDIVFNESEDHDHEG